MHAVSPPQIPSRFLPEMPVSQRAHSHSGDAPGFFLFLGIAWCGKPVSPSFGKRSIPISIIATARSRVNRFSGNSPFAVRSKTPHFTGRAVCAIMQETAGGFSPGLN